MGLIPGGAYKSIGDIKKTLLKDLVYFSWNFFMSIKLIITQSMNFGNLIKCQRKPKIQNHQIEGSNSRIYGMMAFASLYDDINYQNPFHNS